MRNTNSLIGLSISIKYLEESTQKFFSDGYKVNCYSLHLTVIYYLNQILFPKMLEYDFKYLCLSYSIWHTMYIFMCKSKLNLNNLKVHMMKKKKRKYPQGIRIN